MVVFVLILLCMVLECYCVIFYLFKFKIIGIVIKLVIFFVWVISVGLVLLYVVVLKMKDSKCVENWFGNDLRYFKVFILCVFLIFYLSLFCVIIVVYVCVGVRFCVNSFKVEFFVGINRDKNCLFKFCMCWNIWIVKFFVLVVVVFVVCLLFF